MIQPSECCLCSQIAGRQSHDLIAAMLPDQPYVRRVMLDTPSFALIPSLGPLSSGHSLLCPRAHIRSFADVDPRTYGEFPSLKRSLRAAFERLYSNGVHLFEHGMASTGDRILCTVDHAHMHFVPLPESAAVEGAEWITFDGSREQLRELAQGGEYLFHESPGGVCRLRVSQPGGFESQYMRKLLGGERWNWREHPDAPAADQTWRLFAEAGMPA